MKKILIAAVVLLLLLVCEIIRELHTFRVTHYQIRTKKLSHKTPELRIALLSDLHNCSYGKENEKLLTALVKEAPDLILVSGDMLVGLKNTPADVAIAFMEKAGKIAPVFYGNGNHEQRMKEYPEEYGEIYARYKSCLEEAGIGFLENESAQFSWYGETVSVTGYEIPLSYYKKFTGKSLAVTEIEERIGKAQKEELQILIAHNPVHGEAYAKWGADITVSGHLHGGIVRLPFWGGVITPQVRLFPKYSGGMYRIGTMTLVVSKGLGTHTFPIRLLNEAELVMLHIKGTR